MPLFAGTHEAAASSSGYVIGNSCRFNDNDSPELSLTYTLNAPWTLSCWVKRCEITALNNILGTNAEVHFNANDTLEAEGTSSTALFRDPTAWCHIHVSNNGMFFNGVSHGAVTTTNLSDAKLFDDFDGYVAEVHLKSGTDAVTNFAEDDENGNWVPISATSGEHYLTFSNSAALGENSGTGSDWTATNLAANDQVTDSPTDDATTGASNYATLSKIVRPTASGTVSNGGTTSTTSYNVCHFGITSGKWYVEFTPSAITTFHAALFKDSTTLGFQFTADGEGRTYDQLGRYWKDGSIITTGLGNVSVNDVVGMAIDLDNLNLEWFINNVSKKAITDLDAGETWYITAGSSSTINVNFGTAPITGGNADENGYGDFEYAPPSGYLALCTGNLPAPAIADPSSAFVQVTDTEVNIVSTLATARTAMTNYIDFYRNLDVTEGWLMRFSDDSSNHLIMSTTAASAAFPAFSGTNEWEGWSVEISADNGVATGTVGHTTGLGDTTVAHGLGAGQKMVILKASSTTGNWTDRDPDTHSAGKSTSFNNKSVAETTTYYLAEVDDTNVTIQSAAPTATYRWIVLRNTPGVVIVRSYTGNGSADGPYTDMGSTPLWLHLNSLTRADQSMFWSSQLEPGNPIGSGATVASMGLLANLTYDLDMLAGGMKIRHTIARTNSSGAASTVWGFGAFPFGGSGVSQARAR